MNSNPLSQRSQGDFQKVIEKKRVITPYKIVIGLSIFCLAIFAFYQLYTMMSAGASAKIINTHSKFIQNPESSSGQDSGSQTASQSSRASKNSDKPMGVSQPLSKGSITGFLSGGSGGDGEEPSDEDNDGEKREKQLKNNKFSDTSSTEGASDDDDEE